MTPDYAWGQLHRAVARAQSTGDQATRVRAAAKADGWQRVIVGMASGDLQVGSRTPVADTPGWVTLEVLHGGFASGRYIAEHPLDEAETEMVARLGARAPGSTPREQINLWFLSDEGQSVLQDAMRTDRYRVDVPEEAALLVVTWLMLQEHCEAALDLVSELRPLMHRLRFSPRLIASARPPGSLVRLRSVAEVAEPLRLAAANPRVTSMLNTLRVWDPLYDRLVGIWCSTVEGDLPVLRASSQGTTVEGGWPCATWPADWQQQRDSWISDFLAAKASHPFTGRHAQRRSKAPR